MSDLLGRGRLLERHDGDGFVSVSDARAPHRLLFRVGQAAGRTIIEVKPRGGGAVRVDLADLATFSLPTGNDDRVL